MICSSVKLFFICKFSMVENTTRRHSQNVYTIQPQVSAINLECGRSSPIRDCVTNP